MHSLAVLREVSGPCVCVCGGGGKCEGRGGEGGEGRVCVRGRE